MLVKRVILNSAFLLYLINSSTSLAADVNVMPTSGSCSFSINLPIPFGVDVSTKGGGSSDHPYGTYKTGGSVMGVIIFTSTSTASFSSVIVDPLFSAISSPSLRAVDNIYINGGIITIKAMSEVDGFSGGYRMFFSGIASGSSSKSGQTVAWEANVLPSNGGRTLLMQLANSTSLNENSGIGPGTGVCQF